MTPLTQPELDALRELHAKLETAISEKALLYKGFADKQFGAEEYRVRDANHKINNARAELSRAVEPHLESLLSMASRSIALEQFLIEELMTGAKSGSEIQAFFEQLNGTEMESHAE